MLKTANNFYFVYEYCNGGTLDKMMQKEGPLPEKRALFFFKQIVEAFKILSRSNIMHRDIKPCNILIDDSFNVKVCDFGISRNIVRKKGNSFDNFSNLSATSFKQLRENRLSDITNLPSYFFSIAKYNDNIEKKQMQPLTHRIGTRWYRAPELILLNNMYDEKIDIWAAGCVVAEMIGI